MILRTNSNDAETKDAHALATSISSVVKSSSWKRKSSSSGSVGFPPWSSTPSPSSLSSVLVSLMNVETRMNALEMATRPSFGSLFTSLTAAQHSPRTALSAP